MKQLLKETNEKIRFISIDNYTNTVLFQNNKQKYDITKETSAVKIISILNNHYNEQIIKTSEFSEIKKQIRHLNKLEDNTNKKLKFFDPEYDEKGILLDKNMFKITNQDLYDIYDSLKTLTIDKNMIEISYELTIKKYIAKDFELEIPNYSLEYSISNIYDNFYTTNSNDIINIDEFNLETIEQELEFDYLINKNKIYEELDINKYDLILTPNDTVTLISEFILDNLFTEKIKNNKTTISNYKFDNKLNISQITNIDYNPHSKIIDNDFLKPENKEIIKNGNINHTFATYKDYVKYNIMPTKDNTNLIYNIKPGTKTFEKLISNTDKGILINNILGLHTTDSNSGKLSVAIDGSIIKNGSFEKNIKGLKININFFEYLKNIEISKEQKRIYNFYAPFLFLRR